jgi:cytochrome P450
VTPDELALLIGSADPYPRLAELRTASPCLITPGFVVVARHADCAAVLRHADASADRQRARGASADRPRSNNFLNLDPPDHTRLRRLVSRAFTPRVVADMEPRVRAITHELLDAAACRGSIDIVADLASPLPMAVICGLLGVPPEDQDLMREWSSELSPSVDLPGVEDGDPARSAAVVRAQAGMMRYFRRLVAERRSAPGDDLLSHLIRVSEGEDQLSQKELIATCVLLVNASHETTVNLISNGVLALLRHPSHLRRLSENPPYASAVVDEVLRFDAPVQVSARVARRDMVVGESPVAGGDLMLLLLGAANRDPAVFERPDEFLPERSGAARHLTFGAGAHYCLGSSLGRLEAATALEAVATRLVEPTLAVGEPIYKHASTMRGPQCLPVNVRGIRESVPRAGSQVQSIS